MPERYTKGFYETYLLPLAMFHLPTEAVFWYSEASEKLPQEWEFFHQVCTVGAPDDLYASHRSCPTTYPL